MPEMLSNMFVKSIVGFVFVLIHSYSFTTIFKGVAVAWSSVCQLWSELTLVFFKANCGFEVPGRLLSFFPECPNFASTLAWTTVGWNRHGSTECFRQKLRTRFDCLGTLAFRSPKPFLRNPNTYAFIFEAAQSIWRFTCQLPSYCTWYPLTGEEGTRSIGSEW